MMNSGKNHKIPHGPIIRRPISIIPSNPNPNPKYKIDNYDKRKVGIAFLNPGACATNRKKSTNWFRAVPTKEEIILVARQNPQIVPFVMMKLNLQFNSPQEFEKFVSTIDPNNAILLTNLRNLFYQGINQQKSTLPPLQEIDYPFSDIRYSKANCEHQMLCEPIILGPSNREILLNPPSITLGNHIILQSFMAGVQPPVSKWPQTLSIYVNDKLVKPPCIFHYFLIDLTYFGPIKSIRITYQKERNNYVLILREASFRSFDEIIKDLYNLPESKEFFREGELSLFCPISGELMKEPGKGKNCNHTQSFDLNNFLQMAIFQHRWACPICNQNLEFSDLIYSHESKRRIDSFKSYEDFNLFDASTFADQSGMTDVDFNDINESDY